MLNIFRRQQKPSPRKLRVLQVYALTGLGHLREATAIKKALDRAQIENDTLDILKWAQMHSTYSRVAVMPLNFFKWFFEVSTRNSSSFNSVVVPNFFLRGFLVLIRLFELPLGLVLRKYLRSTDYDVFLAVHPWGLGALWSFGLGRKLTQRLVNVIPDEIDIGSASFYGIPGGANGPLHLVNSQRVQSLFEAVNVFPDRIRVIGHTLDPDVFDQREQTYRRVQRALSRNSTLTLGLYIGGTGTQDEQVRIKKIIIDLKDQIKAGLYKIKVIPGPHLSFAEDLHKLVSELGLSSPKHVEIFSSVNRGMVIETGHSWFIHDIDVLFAKTGEIVFYSLATGIPHIHLPPKGSNEVEHVNLMKTLNAIYEFDRIKNLHTFLQDRLYLRQLSTNAFRSNYKLDGAFETVRILTEEIAPIRK
jgi:hypothetical protein